MITGCPDPIRQTTAIGMTSAVVTWTEPTAVDNSGAPVACFKSHDPGSTFAVGVSQQVTYVCPDQQGNDAVCSFTVTGKWSFH